LRFFEHRKHILVSVPSLFGTHPLRHCSIVLMLAIIKKETHLLGVISRVKVTLDDEEVRSVMVRDKRKSVRKCLMRV
jgi:hypothetical protein